MPSEWMKFKLKDKKDFFKGLKNGKIKKDQLLILFLLGVLLLVIALPTGTKKSENVKREGSEYTNREASGYMTEQEYVSYMEKSLENVLSQMDGTGDVTVMITLKESSEKVIEKDTETSSESVTEEDAQGGMRTTKNSTLGETTIYDGNSSSTGFSESSGEGQTPYVRKEITPKVEGVVVVASGGDHAVVIKNITESVQALFGIDTHKIRIVKKE